MSLRLRTGSALALLSMIGAFPTIAAAQGSPEETMLASVKNGPLAKLGPWLANLYDEFVGHRARARSNPAIPS